MKAEEVSWHPSSDIQRLAVSSAFPDVRLQTYLKIAFLPRFYKNYAKLMLLLLSSVPK